MRYIASGWRGGGSMIQTNDGKWLSRGGLCIQTWNACGFKWDFFRPFFFFFFFRKAPRARTVNKGLSCEHVFPPHPTCSHWHVYYCLHARWPLLSFSAVGLINIKFLFFAFRGERLQGREMGRTDERMSSNPKMGLSECIFFIIVVVLANSVFWLIWRFG